MHPEDRARAELAAQDWLDRHEGDIDLEYRIHHPAKGLRWLALTGRILYDFSGQPYRMMGLVIDITERKQAEMRAQQAQAEAERANAAKSRFLATANHDIRQPIQAAVLFLSLLERRDLDQQTRDLVSRLTGAVSGVQGMLEGLLELARLEACIIVPDIRDIARMTCCGIWPLSSAGSPRLPDYGCASRYRSDHFQRCAPPRTDPTQSVANGPNRAWRCHN